MARHPIDDPRSLCLRKSSSIDGALEPRYTSPFASEFLPSFLPNHLKDKRHGWLKVSQVVCLQASRIRSSTLLFKVSRWASRGPRQRSAHEGAAGKGRSHSLELKLCSPDFAAGFPFSLEFDIGFGLSSLHADSPRPLRNEVSLSG